ncbi:MAG: transcription-repair coupling factor, partial [Prevotella sp.]|nr:transcription-repair coupling factor [Prevotella sp.]
MNIQELEKVYARLPQVSALAQTVGKSSVRTIFLEGLLGSSAPMLFGSMAAKCEHPLLFVLQDAEEAGYFYHDLTQLMGDSDVLFFPSSYRRAIKYAQRDAASEILRTEVLARISNSQLYIVTYPEAIAELVVSKKKLDSRTLILERNQTIDVTEIEKTLREFGFREVDYVYEPGQFALRGSILDVYSYSCEYPYRIDFFGDDIDSIRTFEVEDQLSKDRRDRIEIVPELATLMEDKVPFLSFVPKDTVLVVKDFLYIRDAVDRAYQEGFSEQARMEQMEGATEMEQHDIER